MRRLEKRRKIDVRCMALGCEALKNSGRTFFRLATKERYNRRLALPREEEEGRFPRWTGVACKVKKKRFAKRQTQGSSSKNELLWGTMRWRSNPLRNCVRVG